MKIIKIILLTILLFSIKNVITFLIDYYSIVDAPAKMFPRDFHTGELSNIYKYYVALEFIYGIWIYLAVVLVFYFLATTKYFSTWSKRYILGFILVVIIYVIYAIFEEPPVIRHGLRNEPYTGLNLIFVKGIITFSVVGISLGFLSKRIKLI